MQQNLQNQIDFLPEDNKYFKWYWNICERAKNRILPEGIYVERHHIYPKSIYDENNELVKLTAKEHYIAHLVLWFGLRQKYGKSDSKTRKMASAYTMMNRIGKTKREIKNGKEYSLLRLAYSEWQIGRKHSEESKIKISLAKTGVKRSEKAKLNMSKAQKGKNNPMYGKCAYDIWVEKYGCDEALIRKQNMAKKLSEFIKTNKTVNGEKNGMFGKNVYEIILNKKGYIALEEYKQKIIECRRKQLLKDNLIIIKIPSGDLIYETSISRVRKILKCSWEALYLFLKNKHHKNFELIFKAS